ncbi:MAG: histidine kinase, partial [Clostridia bacterium]|nr:histidine kinase [Clostridia bacterium]
LDPTPFINVMRQGREIRNERVYLAEYKRFVEQSVIYDKDSHLLIAIIRDITDEQNERERRERQTRHTIEVADNVVDKQMRIVQEIASLLGETAAETKIALAKLKESISDE